MMQRMHPVVPVRAAMQVATAAHRFQSRFTSQSPSSLKALERERVSKLLHRYYHANKDRCLVAGQRLKLLTQTSGKSGE